MFNASPTLHPGVRPTSISLATVSLSEQPTQQTLLALHFHHLIDIHDTNEPMRRVDLHLIASPFVFPQQAEIADKVPPCGA